MLRTCSTLLPARVDDDDERHTRAKWTGAVRHLLLRNWLAQLRIFSRSDRAHVIVVAAAGYAKVIIE